MKEIHEIIADELSVKPEYVKNVISMLDEGDTIPFIARYRKEQHGSMDDTALRKLLERLTYLRNLNDRKNTIRTAIEEQGKMTDALSKAIDEAMTQTALEDIYRPYKQKRKTRASAAKEKGLEPLAVFLFTKRDEDPVKEAEKYIDPQKNVVSAEDALAGACDILAENISDSPKIRAFLRNYIKENAVMESKAAGEADSVYRQYYDFTCKLNRLKGHQVLALNRGEKEGFLKVSMEFDADTAKTLLKKCLSIKKSKAAPYLEASCEDAFTRLIRPSLEREQRSELTDAACDGAIHNFAVNLKPLLMQPPVKGKVTMGLDPGYSHGCKTAVVDENGKVLDTCVVYPTFGPARREEAIRTLSALVKKHHVQHIAIGNGTASRETESMAADMINRSCPEVSYAIVNEAGASVYSASALGAAEFPDYDVNIRSAISIARRLQDPLAELVKIDPMSIGVGQYQHDMPSAKLESTLSGVVEDCVNAVGVDINSASSALLLRVSGINGTAAGNIVKYREEKGAFKSRKEILKVPKLGPKTFEQCAGFLRVPESSEILDNTAVHPESYEAAKKLLNFCSYTKEDVRNRKLSDFHDRVASFGEEKTAEMCGIGVPTLRDIMKELMKPGRDPRSELPPVVLRKDVLSIDDLTEGMKLKGTVRNVIDFGAFVDIGVHHDGLIHISQLGGRYVKHPSEVLKVGDIVEVKILHVDKEKNKISLTMKDI